MGTFSFGSYYPGDGVLYRLDPRAKLLGGISFLIITLLARTATALVPPALFVVALYLLARVPAGRAVRSVAPLLGIVVVVGILNLFTDHSGAILVQLGPLAISEGSLSSFAFISARMVIMMCAMSLVIMMCAMSLVTMTTQTLDLTHAVERLLAPLARFGVPAHEIGMMLGIALRFMPQFSTELTQTYRAQVSRGARLAGGPLGGVRMLSSVSIPLFASIFRHAETLSAAMDARCYHGEQGRTRMHPLRFAARDAGAAACLVALAVAVVAVSALTSL